MAKVNIRSICEECGKEPIKDTEKSNDNWNVYSTECTYCGGYVKIVVE